MTHSFKEGDRVTYGDGTVHGTVTRIEHQYKVWAKWDDDGDELWLHAHELGLVDSPKNDKVVTGLTVESCIEFLTSKGFSVTLTKQ